MDRVPYLGGTDRYCPTPQTVEQVHYAPRDDHAEEPLAAAEYLLEEIDLETPQVFYDTLSEVKVSTEVGHDPEDSTLLEEQDDRAPFDKRSYIDSHAAKALLGDFDVHSGNIQVTADGHFYPIDVEATGKKPVEYIHDNLDVNALNRYSVVERVEDANFGQEEPPQMEEFTTAIEEMADRIDLDRLEQRYREDNRITYDRAPIDEDGPVMDNHEGRQLYIDELSPAETVVRNIETVRDGGFGSGPGRHLTGQVQAWIDGLADKVLQD